MDNIKKYKDKIMNIFSEKNNKTVFFILLLGLIGILLITLSDLFLEKASDNTSMETKSSMEIFEQEKILENRIETEISKIYGAGKTSVTIIFDTSKEFYYAKNSTEEENTNEKNRENEFVIIEGEKGEEPIVVKTKEAKIRGVLIICEGGDNSAVREKIIEAICALLDIPSNCVSVAKMA